MLIQDVSPAFSSSELARRYLSEAHLSALGRELGQSDRIDLPISLSRDISDWHAENWRTITSVYYDTLAAVQIQQMISPAAEWLIDNFHLVDDNLRQVRQVLPPRYYRRLPTAAIGAAATAPRALAFAWLYAAHSHSEVVLERLTAMVAGYQESRVFRIGELWAIPSILRFVLLDELAALAGRIRRSREMRDCADDLADRLALPEGREHREQLLAAHLADAENDTFASHLLYRLRDAPAEMNDAIDWLETRLESRNSNAEEVLITEQTQQSTANVLIGNIIRSLRTINDVDWTEWFSQVSKVDALLARETSFGALDFKSQDSYRAAIEELSRLSRREELDVAGAALRLSNSSGDIGHWLIGPRRGDLEREIGARPRLKTRVARRYRRLGWLAIAGPVVAMTLLLVAAAAASLNLTGLSTAPLVALLIFAALPLSEAATGLFNSFTSFVSRPARLPGFEYPDGVPPDAATLVVIPSLLLSRDAVDDLCRNLEVHYLANSSGYLSFALLSDWVDSPNEEAADDAEILAYARQQIDRLAKLYDQDGRRRFFLLHRRRLFNPSENAWMGWERKRGKLIELNMLLRGDRDTTFLAPEAELPDDIQYVMTLDSDTRLTRDAVTRLVGKLAHPLNHPVLDETGRRLIAGYGILQPRVTPSLTTGAEASVFQRVFSYGRGVDPYVFTVSDTYQDLTGEGSFTGKGLYHVDTVRAVLGDAFPENAILSHDLLEGALARCALVTDVELIEDFPVRYDVEAARQHRWARGDVQLLPLIFRDGRIGGLGRWKMIDNLRRLLVPVTWLAASITGWFLFDVGAALLWQAFLMLSLFVAPTLTLVRASLPPRVEVVLASHAYSTLVEALSATAQVGLRVVFIAHYAVLMADALLRSLFRVYVSRRLLLEWRSAAVATSVPEPSILHYYTLMRLSVALSVGVLVLLLTFDAPGIGIGAVFCFAWVLAPVVAWWVSQSAETEDRLRVSEEDRLALRRVARRTWSYFDTFVTEEHCWLPPDNFQESPSPVAAPRTSPTNIALYLLSVVSAREFGWISLSDAVRRVESTLDTLERMEKLHGHLFNWYETTTLNPLMPRYVSTVDSGNLAGHLVALSATLRDWAAAPFVHLWTGTEGIADVAGVLSEEIEAVPDDRRGVRPLRRRLEERLEGFYRALGGMASEPALAPVRVLSLSVIADNILKLAQEFDHEVGSSQTATAAHWATRLKATCEAVFSDVTFAISATEALRERMQAAAATARNLAFGMDFAFLMRPERRLLAIGFNVQDGHLDTACYDLLASEARLTSLFAIAKGDLPTEHWFRLGRPMVSIGARGALMSWSGSMFEYLMPPLVMQEQTGGILNQSNILAVRRQIEYGRARRVPWGISEAALNARDREMTYQYSNFGVPSLGMKRGLATDLVVAPYATLLAAQYQPRAAVRNLGRLEALGARGAYGYYDAVDFTPARVPEGSDCAVVRNYMAHHQGMSIVAIANVVFQGRLRERFHSDPVIEAAELLLQEKAPREVPALAATAASERISGRAELAGGAYRVIADPASSERAVALLSNGHYGLMLTATGGGWAVWNGLSVTRFHPDPVEEVWGTFLFLRDVESGDWWSATTAPRQAEGETAHAVFSESKAEFHKIVGKVRSRVDVIVASESDSEGRCLSLFNDGEEDRIIEVTSYAEPVLSRADADRAHPAFSKMFVKTEIADGGAVIHVWRNKRRPDEPDIHVAHLMADSPGGARATEAETDRRRFIGRGRRLAEAAAFDPGATLSGADGFTLDPIMALRRQVRVPAGKEARVLVWTVAAPSRAEAEMVIARHLHLESFEREAMQAWTRSQIQLRHVGVDPDEAAVFQRLARYLVMPDDRLKVADASGRAPQSALWSLSISGDHPIVTLRVDDPGDLEIVRKALRGYEYLRSRALQIDLVILNEHAASYSQDLHDAIESVCASARHRGVLTGAGEHVFVVRRDQIDEAAYDALLATSRAVFHARNGRFSVQIERAERLAAADPRVRKATVPRRPAPARPVGDRPDRAHRGGELSFWNGHGGFDVASREYVVRPAPGHPTPQPWINVVANEGFGFHVSAEGAGYTWSVNSRDHQITPWSNDPVIDRPGEGIWVVCRDTGQVLSPLPMLDPGAKPAFEVRHGIGYTRFHREGDALELDLTQWVDPVDPVKLSRLTVANAGAAPRRLRIYAYAEWVLGASRDITAPHLTVAADRSARCVCARNPFSIEFPGRAAFLASDRPVSSVTGDRASFFGKGGVWHPAALDRTGILDGSSKTGGDPCGALTVDITVAPGVTEAVTFTLGDAWSEGDLADLLDRHAGGTAPTACAEATAHWTAFLDTLQIETPDPAMDAMVNVWLPYQGVVCRLRARSAFYQASGAFGFRDQLQDTLAFLWHDPGMARRQIIAAAGRQFPDGDVQHWWLPGSGAGVRTMISDDVVWLAYALAHYMQVTGDAGILDETVPFLSGPTLEPGQHDAYFQPEISDERVSVFEHAARALDLAILRTGEHGLPLILGGDWNDGMNRVGEAGRGESVWLGWFLAHALHAWIPVAEGRGDADRVGRWSDHLAALRTALDGPGWDGAYYRRGFYDDGTPLGSHVSDECRIDSIAQSWSVMSGLGEPTRCETAMQSVLDSLVDRDAGIIRLFTPPFAETAKEPGYIKGYPPGVRENGGQYTHAATWVVCALALLGRGDDAHACFSMLNPILHSRDSSAAETYRTEPYAVAADIYSEGERAGRGGWTWYTGSAGWLYRAAVEGILGLRKQGNRLHIAPSIPGDWDGYVARLRWDGRVHTVNVRRDEAGSIQINVDGRASSAADGSFALREGCEHTG